MSNDLLNSQEIRTAFAEYDRQVTVSNFKVACVLGMILMPAGVVLDRFMYPGMALSFLKLRLVCSLLIAVFLAILLTPFGRLNYRFFGVTLFMLPASFIAWMIYATEGAASPYYAGLNLVMLVLAFVLHWTFWESFSAAFLVIVLYVTVSFAHGKVPGAILGQFVNNLYFLSLTGIIVVTGSYFHSLSRFREFALRYELDKSRKALEVSLRQLKENEMQLVQSEKLASLGRLSAGIIHEINNPLNFATTGLFTLRKKAKHVAPDQQAEFSEVLADIEEGVKRVKTIVSDLRMFSHPDTEHCDDVSALEVVESALRFLSNEWKDTIQIERKLSQPLRVWANKNKLIHVMVNLLQNSVDAIRSKTYPPGEKPTIWVEGRMEQGRTILSVRDNGSGIGGEHLDKIFDPFFTTKDVGEGMGLGLSICYRIIQECDGKISVRTEPGKFCEFTLEFPAKQ
jgi:two-component system sensor histidine kinase PhcS